MLYYVYVLFSEEYNKIYIGFTSDLNGRLAAHNHPSNKGWTASFRPWKVIYFEEFNDKLQAMQREKELKSSRGRAFIKSTLIPKP